MKGEDLFTVLIKTGIHDEKVRSQILENLKIPTLDDTVKLIEQMVYAKNTHTRSEKGAKMQTSIRLMIHSPVKGQQKLYIRKIKR